MTVRSQENTKSDTYGPTAALSLNSGKITNNGYIVGKYYDWIWFIGAPTLGLVLALIFLLSGWAHIKVSINDNHTFGILDLFIGTFIMAHLFIVFFRSHGNPAIFKLHPVRFIVVPIVLILSMTYSMVALIAISVLAIWWDVYHSAAQTFGLGRIYDMRYGNDPRAGRRLDYLINLLIYLGPILAGASLLDHLIYFKEFQVIGVQSLGKDIPSYIFNHKSELNKLVLIIGIPFLIYYIYAYWKLYQQGYVFSFNKVFLLVSTAFISIFCWGFNTLGEAFFVMNFFHAWQYFAIVWAFEKKNITRLFGLSGVRIGKHISLILFVLIAFMYGFWVTTHDHDGSQSEKFMHAMIAAVSILHFWYDSFIWSVQKKQV